MTPELRHLLLSLADDELILGHRDSEWCAFAPFIEEDIALASIAQDEISHATVYLTLLCEETGESPDHLAFLREPGDFRNARLLERPNQDWAFTVVRHLAYDIYDDLRLEALAQSRVTRLAQAVDRLRREERYHLLHGQGWLARLAGSPGQARTRVEAALAQVLPDMAGLFEETELERAAVGQGLMPVGPAALAEPWRRQMQALLTPWGLEGWLPAPAALLHDPAATALGGRAGSHSDELAPLLARMGEVYRSDAQAAW